MMEKTKLVGLGELLLRLDTPGHQRFSQAESFGAKFTGGEANVLVAARRFGVETCALVSRLPDNPLGEACLEFLRRYGIDTRHVALGGERLGILFVETGQSVRPTRVVYDRSHTSFRDINPDDYDWEWILRDAAYLHITGTAPALGENVNRVMDQAIEVARRQGCGVSFDCSYRSALWGVDAAGQAYRRLAREADLLFASPADAELFFGLGDGDENDRMRRLMDEYELSRVAWTKREEKSASSNLLRGTIWAGAERFESRVYDFEIVDRIGSGDAFAGAVLSGLMREPSAASITELIEFATAAAVFKHTIPGDFCLASRHEIEELVAGKSLRIRR